MPETTENKKVIKNDEIDLVEVFRKIWANRKTIYKTVAILFIIGLIIVFGTPKEYISEVTLLVETGTSSSGMSGLLQQFGGLAGIQVGDAGGEDALSPKLYPDVIKSTPFLLEVMNKKVTESKYDSTLTVAQYLECHTRSSLLSFIKGYTIGLPWKIIGLFKGNPHSQQPIANSQRSGPLKLTEKQSSIAGALTNIINAKQGDRKSTLSISVEVQDPFVAAQLLDSVVKSLTGYIIDYRTQKAKFDLKFVQERHAEAESRFIKAQRDLAAFMDQNKNIVMASAQNREQNLQSEYNLAFNMYNSISQQLEQSKMKVQEKTPVFKVLDPAMVPLQKSKPKTDLILFMSVLSGVIVGIGIILGKMIYASKPFQNR